MLWIWIIGITTQVMLTVALYHMANRRFSTGTLWAGAIFMCGIIAFVFSGWLFALIVDGVIFAAFGASIFFDASVNKATEMTERKRIRGFLKEIGKLRKAEQSGHSDWAHVDAYLEQLISEKKLLIASTYAEDRLRAAHEQSNLILEKKYRAYLSRITTDYE